MLSKDEQLKERQFDKNDTKTFLNISSILTDFFHYSFVNKKETAVTPTQLSSTPQNSSLSTMYYCSSIFRTENDLDSDLIC